MLRKLVHLAELVRWEHTIFALPFAYAATFLASGGWPSGHDFFWVTVAMVGARTAAMGLNRLVDRALDALNPRTSQWHLPRGAVKPGEVVGLVVVSLALLALAAAMLNPLCLKLFPVALVVLVVYPYTKRFTWGCHFVLGLAEFAAPFGGWIAVTGAAHPAAYLLGAGAGLWVAGFDILYSLADVDFDRAHGVHSIPARFGIREALRCSLAVHVLAWACLFAVLPVLGAGFWYAMGLLAMALLLVYEHSILSVSDLSRLNRAFFDLNGIISVVFFATTALAAVLR
ncbi:MAG: UbiA-like polyprenyltransferase [Bacillota bacterium]|nr:UbiA-like polyprenyltransferase [Bacillota bacterium]MDI7249302.1 UbiA-like polyprenyltransferase [Bacillota bacterium]